MENLGQEIFVYNIQKAMLKSIEVIYIGQDSHHVRIFGNCQCTVL
jgi:hypothetical protein